MTDHKHAALEAIYEGIARVATELEADKGYQPHSAAEVLADLALAYRYASGGPQPGSVTVDK